MSMFDEGGAVNLVALNNAAASANGTHTQPSVGSSQIMSQLMTTKDSSWLQLEVCREFQRGQCSRTDEDCKFAHPPPHVDIQNGRVTACYDSIKGRCTRDNPKCKYLHPPQHLKDQLLINGKNNLALKNLICSRLSTNQSAAIIPNFTSLPQLMQQPPTLVPSLPFPQYAFPQLPTTAALHPALLGATAITGPTATSIQPATASQQSLPPAVIQQLLLLQQQQQQQALAAALSSGTGAVAQPNSNSFLMALALQQQQQQALVASFTAASSAGQLTGVNETQMTASNPTGQLPTTRKRNARLAGLEATGGESDPTKSIAILSSDVVAEQAPTPSSTNAANSISIASLPVCPTSGASLLALQQQQILAGGTASAGPQSGSKRVALDSKNGAAVTANGVQMNAALYAAQFNPYVVQQVPGYAALAAYNGQQIPPRY